MLPALLEGLVPVLVSFVENLLSKTSSPSNADSVREWVMPLLKEVAGQFDKYLPSWLKPEESALEALLSDAIDRALNKVEGK